MLYSLFRKCFPGGAWGGAFFKKAASPTFPSFPSSLRGGLKRAQALDERVAEGGKVLGAILRGLEHEILDGDLDLVCGVAHAADGLGLLGEVEAAQVEADVEAIDLNTGGGLWL